MNDLTQEYGEFTIAYKETIDQWVGSLDKIEIHRAAKLSDLKKALDRHYDKEHKFTRVPIFKRGGKWSALGNWMEGEVTSITEEGHIWITWKDKSRSKEGRWSTLELYLMTSGNLEARKKWDALEVEITALQEKQDKLLKGMKKFEAKQEAGT